MSRRFGRVLAVATLLVAVVGAGLPSNVMAAFPACAGTGNFHSGQKISENFGNTIWGAQATLEYFDEDLCDGNTSKSFSSTWVAIVATSPNDPFAFDIYQVGIIKCRTCNYPSVNTTYIVWAYGREGTVCSPGKAPTQQRSTSASIANTTYKVARGVDADGNPVYYAQAGATRITASEQPVANLETCWVGGPKKAFYANETGNTSDQSGGRPNAPQNFFGAKLLKNNGAWVNMNLTVGNDCPDTALATQFCEVGPATDGLIIWDSRG